MFSPIKIALFALISFATLAVAIPTPETCHADTKGLITGTNVLLQKALLPICMSACLFVTNPDTFLFLSTPFHHIPLRAAPMTQTAYELITDP